MYYPFSENKGADQMCSYCTADLRNCFRICKLLLFYAVNFLVKMAYPLNLNVLFSSWNKLLTETIQLDESCNKKQHATCILVSYTSADLGCDQNYWPIRSVSYLHLDFRHIYENKCTFSISKLIRALKSKLISVEWSIYGPPSGCVSHNTQQKLAYGMK